MGEVSSIHKNVVGDLCCPIQALVLWCIVRTNQFVVC